MDGDTHTHTLFSRRMVRTIEGNNVAETYFHSYILANYSLTGYYAWKNIPTIRSTFSHGVICSTLLRLLNGKKYVSQNITVRISE